MPDKSEKKDGTKGSFIHDVKRAKDIENMKIAVTSDIIYDRFLRKNQLKTKNEKRERNGNVGRDDNKIQKPTNLNVNYISLPLCSSV